MSGRLTADKLKSYVIRFLLTVLQVEGIKIKVREWRPCSSDRFSIWGFGKFVEINLQSSS